MTTPTGLAEKRLKAMQEHVRIKAEVAQGHLEYGLQASDITQGVRFTHQEVITIHDALDAKDAEIERLRGYLRQIKHYAGTGSPAFDDRQRFGRICSDADAALRGDS